VDHFPTTRAAFAYSPVAHCVGAFTVLAYSAVVATILALIVKYAIGLRLNEEDEEFGIDEAEHDEAGDDFAVAGGASVHGRHGAEE